MNRDSLRWGIINDDPVKLFKNGDVISKNVNKVLNTPYEKVLKNELKQKGI